MPHISVIIPVYKVEPYLHRCVDSILNQTFTDHEPILVNDGSPDRCGEMCEEYAVADSRVIVIHQKNGGLSCARNTGIDFSFACSDSEWISFIDSDDWVSINCLSSLYNACVSEKSDIAVCGFQRTDGMYYNEAEDSAYTVLSPESLWCQDRVNTIVAWGKLYRKTKWEDVRFPVRKIHEDEYTTYKILFKSGHIAYIDSKLYYYYQNPNGIIGSVWAPERMDIIEAIRQQFDFFKTRNLNELAEDSVLRLFTAIWYNLKNAEECWGPDSKYSVVLKKKLRKCLRRYRKYADVNVDNYGSLYTIAYPLEMKVYHFYHGLINTLHDGGIVAILKKIGFKIRGFLCRK